MEDATPVLDLLNAAATRWRQATFEGFLNELTFRKDNERDDPTSWWINSSVSLDWDASPARRVESFRARLVVRGDRVFYHSGRGLKPIKSIRHLFDDLAYETAPYHGMRLTYRTIDGPYPIFLEAQMRWWRFTNKKFRLNDLPAELRSMIYDLCMPSEIDNNKVDPVYFTLRLLTKQTAHEIRAHLLERTKKFFTRHDLLERFFRAHRHTTLPINRVNISFFGRTFGILTGARKQSPEKPIEMDIPLILAGLRRVKQRFYVVIETRWMGPGDQDRIEELCERIIKVFGEDSEIVAGSCYSLGTASRDHGDKVPNEVVIEAFGRKRGP